MECMVTFDDACHIFLGVPKVTVARYPLVDNFRSHSDIVTFFDDYIRAFPVMANPGARAPKPSIRAKKTIPQVYTAVGRLSAGRLDDLAIVFAQTVRGLVDNGVVNDPSECCLLLKSTKETPFNAEKYVDALINELGALLAVVDPYRRYATDPSNRNAIPTGEPNIRATFDRLASANVDLADYVSKATAALKTKLGQPLDANLQELAYYLMSLEPFSTWQQDPVRRVRLGKLTKLLEAYSSMPVLDLTTGLPRPNVSRGFMLASNQSPGEVDARWLGGFYHLFIGYVLTAGFDDEEEEDVIVPAGMVPVMTMHQSKGLEFPFVFVGHMGENPNISATHELETLFSGYPANPARTFTRAPALERAEMDLIRQYYVAYSRAKYALVLLGTNAHFSRQTVPLGPVRNWVRHRTNTL